MSRLLPIERLEPRRHEVGDFSCGAPELDRWLRAYAGQAGRRDAARTFVVADRDHVVVGYYTLVVGQVDHRSATGAVQRGMSARFPIPVCLVARLAVTSGWQAKGVGSGLLLDALRRVAGAAELVGIRAVLVHARDEAAAGFYRGFGFEPATPDGLTLMVPMAAVRATVAQKP